VAYRADIEIAVRGAQELKRLQNAILSASDAVNSLNSNLSGVANLVPRSFDNLNRTVAQAARSFNAAALGTKEATDAAREYVRATDAANAGLRERVALLAKVQAGQRRTVPGDAGVGQQTPALPPQLIRTYEIGKNWVKFFQDAAGVAVDLQARALNTKASWNDFFATAAQAAVNVKANSLNTQKNWNDFFATAAQAAVNVKANSLNTKASWNKFFIEAAQLADDLTARTRQIEGSASAAARNRLAADQEARRTAAPEVPRRLISGVAAPQGMAPGNASVSTAMQGPLAGPGAMGFPVALSLSKVEQAGLETAAKKQEILQRMAATRQALVGLAANLQRLDQNSAVAIADAVRNQLKLNAAKLKELDTTQQIRATEAAASKAARQRLSDAAALRSPAASKKGGFLSELSNPSSKIGSAVIGGGFPALMGGGPGTIAGGAIGGILGGFAGSIGGSAIGQFLDQAVQKVQELGNAINTLNFDNVTKSGVRLTGELRTQLDLLLKVGQAQQAQELVSQEVAAATGTPAGTTEDIANAVNLLNVAFNSVVGTVSTLLGILGAPFVAALAAILGVVNLIVKGLNVVLGFVGSLIKDVGEWVVALVGGEDAVRNIERGLAGVNGQFDEAIAKANQLRVELNQDVVAAAQNLAFERRMTPGSTAGEKLTNNDVELEKKLAGLTTDRLNAIQEIRKENAQADLAVPGTVAGLVAQKNLAFDLVEQTERLAAARRAESIQIQENARLAQEAARAAEKAARAAEEAARTAAEQFKALLSINKDYLSDQLKLIALNVQQIDLFKGTEAALKEQLNVTNTIGRIRVEILETERDIALEEAKKLGTTAQVLQQYELKFKVLQAELNIQTKITEQSAAQVALQKQLRTNELQQSKQEAVRSLKVQQDKVSLDIAAFTQDPKAVEAARLNLDQITRAYETELSVQKEIDKLNTEIASTAFNEEQIANKQNELAIQQSKLDSLREELTLLDSLEQRQLKLKQFYADYGQLIQSVSGEIANAVTFGVAEMINGTKTAQEVFAQFLNSIANALLSAAQEMIAQYIAIGIARMFAGMGGGADPTAAGGDWISAVGRLSPNAKGNAFGANGIAPFARGGAFTNSVVGSPTMFKFAQGGAMRTGLMGEAGPEAILPLKRGADGSLGVMASGGGGDVNVVVNVDAKGSSVEGDEQGANQLGRVISAAVQSELIKQQRPGGILAR
jgi:lambda family phage tail tape measure protein